jgi:histidinol-phosphate phosphatase family protein
MPNVTTVAAKPVSPAKAQLRPREIPADAPATVRVGELTATKVAQTADMVRYVVQLGGKPTFIDLMSKLKPETALAAPEGFLAGRKGVVLTDRDGVLNKASSFLNKAGDVTEDALIPAALEGVRALNEAALGLVIVTNQGGWQSNKMSFEDMIGVNVREAERLTAAGGRIDGIVICPMNTELEGGAIDARKPSPGMPLHVMAMAGDVPVLGMVGDQRTDGGAGQAAGLPFFAITDTQFGRWVAESEQAKKKGETLPTLDPAMMVELPSIAAVAARLAAGAGAVADGFTTQAAAPGPKVAANEARATGAAQTLRGTARTAELPAGWLDAAAKALGQRAQVDETGYYDERVLLHGNDAAAVAKALDGATFTAGSELLMVNVTGGDELHADVLAFDVLTNAVRELGTLEMDALDGALAWDGFETPARFSNAVRLEGTREDHLAGFDEITARAPTTGT